jgi:hypothetical protein
MSSPIYLLEGMFLQSCAFPDRFLDLRSRRYSSLPASMIDRDRFFPPSILRNIGVSSLHFWITRALTHCQMQQIPSIEPNPLYLLEDHPQISVRFHLQTSDVSRCYCPGFVYMHWLIVAGINDLLEL